MENKQKVAGFSLIEVMIAASIGLGIFYFLNSMIVNLQKSQRQLEKRGELNTIKLTVKTYLSDVRAWEESPEIRVPSIENESNFFYFPSKREDLKKMTKTLKEYRRFNKNFNCRKEINGCRIASFDYKGRIFDPDKFATEDSGYFLVQIGFENTDDEVSRSFVPEFRVYITDTEDEPSLKVNDQLFFVNSNSKNNAVLGEALEVIDPNNRANCFLKFVDSFPKLSHLAVQLCEKATSSMPAECFIKMKNEFKASDLVAMVTCSRAKNPKPIDCFHEASKKYGQDNQNVAVLCSGATSLMPVDCIDKVKEEVGLGHPGNIEYLVCARSNDLSPAECYIKIHKRDKDHINNALRLCVSYK